MQRWRAIIADGQNAAAHPFRASGTTPIGVGGGEG
jgi:hypothetical protein